MITLSSRLKIFKILVLLKMDAYANMTREELVELLNLRYGKIIQLEDEILELKRGSIYILQFKKDFKLHIFKRVRV